MANLNFLSGIPLCIISALGSFYTYCLLKKPISRKKLNFIKMMAYSNLGMLTGWLIDFDGLPLLREGVCLCGCAHSTLGLGLCHCLWMYIGMYLGCLPALWRHPHPISCYLSCLAMGPGMWVGSYTMTFIPLFDPLWYFFLTIIAMVLGMIGAMKTTDLLINQYQKLKSKSFSIKPMLYS